MDNTALALNPSNNCQTIIIKLNERGYHSFREFDTSAEASAFVFETNQRWGITPEVADAYLVGSMLGWSVPGAREAFNKPID